jgi:putative transposase
MKLVYRYRVKSLTGLLDRQARTVNFVWNYCNDRQKDALRFDRPWLTGFDLIKLTTGCSKELGLHSGTINDVCQQYARSRSQSNRPCLRYRGKKSLGWVPLKGRELKREGDAFRFAGNTFRVFYSRPLPDGKITDGTNFSCDRRGNWYLNIVLEVAEAPLRCPERGVGIDLGLKEFVAMSEGFKVPAPHLYRDAEAALATAQRAGKRKRVKAIHAKIANRRRDFLHMLSICSDCGALPDSRPKGIADLGVRKWICSGCGVVHDRDLNAAKNILRRGRATLAVGIPVL